MPRFTMTLPKATYNRITAMASQCNDSMSNIMNQLIEIGMEHADQNRAFRHAEQHSHQLSIQTNVLVKNMAAEFLKFSQEDFEKLKRAAEKKYNELVSIEDIPQS
jgi:hypothetical protein